MKTLIKQSAQKILADRGLLFGTLILILLTLGLVIYTIAAVNPSELQLVSRYSAFGTAHLYRQQWFYLLLFGLSGIIVAALHIMMTVKLLIDKDRTIAMIFLWLGIFVIALTYATAGAVINVWSPL